MNTREFFKEIYKNCTDGFITLTTLPSRKTTWFKVSEIEKLSDISANIGKKTNVFFGVVLRKNILSNGLRGGEKDISCVTAFYADIDIKGDTHAQKFLPENADEARDFLKNLKIRPSIIVNSGNGIHGYWLLDTPFVIKNAEDTNRIATIFKSYR